MQNNQGSQKVRGNRNPYQEIIHDMETQNTQLQVEVGILKTQVANIIQLCDKMDAVIEKLSEGREKIVDQIYEDMADERKETTEDIKELHSRITTVDRNLTDKLESVEDKIMAEIRSLRRDMLERSQKEDSKIDKILEWKWMAAGGILVVTWLLSHIKFDIITKLLN